MKRSRQERAARDDLPPNALSHTLREFIEVGGAHGLSPRTLRQRLRATRRFILWCVDRGLASPTDITLPILERYQRHLYHYRKRDGSPLTFGSQYTELAPLKAYFKWLTRSRYLLYNPAAELELPKVVPKLARYVLSVADVEAILNATDATTPLGVRDRAILEVLYSSAIRRTELMNLAVFDLDTRYGTLLVRTGKGAEDRRVPLGERACQWLARYLDEVRPELLTGRDPGQVFLTIHGEPISSYTLGELVKGYIAKAGVKVQGSCHLLRHACATHMLENGADIRYIQALLGHSDLSSTQIYTHVALNKLKEIHAATHPAKATRVETDTCHASNQTAELDALWTALAVENDDAE